jgi:protein-S-isoprenylcysteine O-methyltransferase Ste14
MSRWIPPPVALAIAAVAMWLIGRSVAFADFSLPYQTTVAVMIIVLGIGVAGWGLRTFARAGTTPNPVDPSRATRLVTSGPYAFTRNPMYLGDAIALLGVAVWTGSALSLLALAAFIAFIDRFQIAAEESALLGIFGEEYAAYRRKVRRWL